MEARQTGGDRNGVGEGSEGDEERTMKTTRSGLGDDEKEEEDSEDNEMTGKTTRRGLGTREDETRTTRALGPRNLSSTCAEREIRRPSERKKQKTWTKTGSEDGGIGRRREDSKRKKTFKLTQRPRERNQAERTTEAERKKQRPIWTKVVQKKITTRRTRTKITFFPVPRLRERPKGKKSKPKRRNDREKDRDTSQTDLDTRRRYREEGLGRR